MMSEQGIKKSDVELINNANRLNVTQKMFILIVVITVRSYYSHILLLLLLLLLYFT
jgi:hypothetical protein